MQASDSLNLDRLCLTLEVSRKDSQGRLITSTLTYIMDQEDLKLSLSSAGSGLQRVVYEMLVRGISNIEAREKT